ncbi:MAG: NAD(P)H-hydrate dehydratase [Pleomorphochaeta sp.]
MKNLYYSQDIAKIDAMAQKDYNQPGLILMEQAGVKAWEYMKHHILKDQSLVFVCGGGNNGGDALVIARCALNAGYEKVKIIYCSNKFSESTTVQKKIIDSYNIFSLNISDDSDLIKSTILNSDNIIDGITGIGLKSQLRDNLINIVDLINLSKAKVFSVDVPSGISDLVCAPCVKADYTFSMGPLKALYFFPKNVINCGKIIEINPSFPLQVIDLIDPVATLNSNLHINVPKLDKTAYKKTRGHLAIFGGSKKYSGALRLASKSAFSSRCGLITAFCDKEIYEIVAVESPSIIVNKIDDNMNLSSYDAILAGPGWDKDREDLLKEILKYKKPTVIDADGIRAYANLYKMGKINVQNNDKLIFTPHLGELKALADSVLVDYSINNTIDFINTLNLLSKKLNAIIVCKASITYIVHPNKIPLIVYKFNPSIAVAGSGDVLAGSVAALVASKLNCYDSAIEAVKIHINAGIKARKKEGFYSSEELIKYIGKQLS